MGDMSEDVAAALYGLDAARRAGWAKAYALTDEVTRLQAELDRLQTTRHVIAQRFRHWIAHHHDAGPVRAALREMGWTDKEVLQASVVALLTALANEVLKGKDEV